MGVSLGVGSLDPCILPLTPMAWHAPSPSCQQSTLARTEHDPCSHAESLLCGKGLLCSHGSHLQQPQQFTCLAITTLSSTVLVKGCDPPPQARAPHHGTRPPSSAPLARDKREIHFTKGSFICGMIREQGWDPSWRQESDLLADGFIISQAQQFGLNKTKPLSLMKTSLMRSEAEAAP